MNIRLKSEAYDYCLQEAELELEFSVRSRDNNVTSRFLNSRLANFKQSLNQSLNQQS